MTTAYCRHCAEPTAGPRESDGVCQRCGETEGEAVSDWMLGAIAAAVGAHEERLTEAVGSCVPVELETDALEREFGLYGALRLNSPTVAECRELLARGRELQAALRPRIERVSGPADDVRAALAEYAASYDGHPDSPTLEHVARVVANHINVVGHLTREERAALADRAAGVPEVSGGPWAEDDEEPAPDWDRLRADEAEERVASTAATEEPFDGLAADARRQGAWALPSFCLQCLGVRPTSDEGIGYVSSADPYHPCSCLTRIVGGVHGRGPDKGKPAADTVFHTDGCELASGADTWLRAASALPVDADADAIVARRIAEITGGAKTRAIAARIDADRTAKPLTRIVADAPVQPGMPHMNPAHVDGETRTELAAVPRCSLCCSEAVVRVELSDGCICKPNDRVQDLCPHHALRSEPIGTSKTVRDYSLGGRFTELYGTPVPRLGSDGPDDGGDR